MPAIAEGDRVRLRPDAPLRVEHPELAGAVGTVGSVMRRASMSTGGESATVHVRFAPPVNVVALNVPASQFELVGGLEPRLRVI